MAEETRLKSLRVLVASHLREAEQESRGSWLKPWWRKAGRNGQGDGAPAGDPFDWNVRREELLAEGVSESALAAIESDFGERDSDAYGQPGRLSPHVMRLRLQRLILIIDERLAALPEFPWPEFRPLQTAFPLRRMADTAVGELADGLRRRLKSSLRPALAAGVPRLEALRRVIESFLEARLSRLVAEDGHRQGTLAIEVKPCQQANANENEFFERVTSPETDYSKFDTIKARASILFGSHFIEVRWHTVGRREELLASLECALSAMSQAIDKVLGSEKKVVLKEVLEQCFPGVTTSQVAPHVSLKRHLERGDPSTMVSLLAACWPIPIQKCEDVSIGYLDTVASGALKTGDPHLTFMVAKALHRIKDIDRRCGRSSKVCADGDKLCQRGFKHAIKSQNADAVADWLEWYRPPEKLKAVAQVRIAALCERAPGAWLRPLEMILASEGSRRHHVAIRCLLGRLRATKEGSKAWQHHLVRFVRLVIDEPPSIADALDQLLLQLPDAAGNADFRHALWQFIDECDLQPSINHFASVAGSTTKPRLGPDAFAVYIKYLSALENSNARD